MKKYLYLFFLLACLTGVGAGRCMAQLEEYNANKEKIYIHTNHVFFKPGDDLFFKVYLVNAADQTAAAASSVVYVDIIGPSGAVIRKLTYYTRDGYAEGHFAFDKTVNGGRYKIRAYTTWMMNEKEDTWFAKDITVQKTIAPRVLMKLDFPQKGYGPGDEVRASYAIRDLADRPIRLYKVKYTVQLGGIMHQNGTITTDTAGKAVIVFTLPSALDTNDGLLNVTIQYDAHTEAISRSIPIVLNKIDLQFMPEGGTLVTGVTTQMAFKAVDENGKPADIKGRVINNRGATVSLFESYHDGMGVFAFTPLEGEQYSAVISTPAAIMQIYALPAAAVEGLVMNVSRKDSLLQVRLVSTRPQIIQLTGSTKNKTYYRQVLSLVAGEQVITVNTIAFPAGIARFTVSDAREMPVAERIVFLQPGRLLQLEVTTDKKIYSPREKVTMHFATKDEQGMPVSSNLSVAVVDDKLWSLADDKQEHILSWLLMSSELKGKIEEPQFYFKKEEPKALPALDLVMLTHGYRYFDYSAYVVEKGQPGYRPDMGNILSGVVLNKKGMPINATVYLLQGERHYYYSAGALVEQKTGADGVFFFTDLSPAFSYQIIARGETKKEEITIRITQQGMGYNPLLKSGVAVADSAGAGMPSLLKVRGNQLKQPVAEVPLFEPENNALNDVVVVGYGTVSKRLSTGSVMTVKGEEIIMMPLENVLQGKAAGVMVTNTGTFGSSPNIRIRGASSLTGKDAPLLILDGVPVEKLDAGFCADNVETITVLKDASATAIYGSMAMNGVVIIESRNAGNKKIKLELGKTYYYSSRVVPEHNNVYDVARRFYAPRYSTIATRTRSDFRETIYWNPVVQTDSKGNATVEFYNSDATTTFRAITEGIGYNGKVGRAEYTWHAQPQLAIDAKIPPYLTTGDSALVPLVIKNNSNGRLAATIKVTVPPGMLVALPDTSVYLLPGSAKQLLVMVKATRALSGEIALMVTAGEATETLILPVIAGNKGFPVITTLSGNNSISKNFTVKHLAPGSLQSRLSVFQNIEGQLLHDIEYMLREPYGCFEQTSSTTYPNVFILKYLQATGKSNAAIKEKALSYIEKGYQRLVGFETTENGFEWFGHAPAHEVLTAYGLLEFTDMKAFVEVDSRMLDRTKAFLLGRRNGKGGFTLRSGGYGGFATVSQKVANAYIVYALTQAGVGSEVMPEYTHAMNVALKSGDAYLLSLMALAADNIKNERDYRQLMDSLKTTQMKAASSIVCSRGVSLKVETMALYTLALAREKQPDLAVMANLIADILKEKTYYGYGSTQATVLALKALVEFQLLVGEKAAKAGMLITLNNEPVTPATDLAPLIREGENAFTVHYPDEKQNLPYEMEVSYYTMFPDNSLQAPLHLFARLATDTARTGETVRMEIAVQNHEALVQPMAVAKIGIPAGLTIQAWQLKEMIEKRQIAYYELFDNYLVLYWMGLAEEETKKVYLDLKAEIPGRYQGRASNTYLYYMPEHKHWQEGAVITILP